MFDFVKEDRFLVKVIYKYYVFREINMTLLKKINDWKKYPNALGSESQVSVLVGELAAILKKEIPEPVKSALKTLALRGTMRDIASAIGRNIEQRNLRTPSFHEVVDSGAASCGISWTEAVAVLAQYVTECEAQLPPDEHIPINEIERRTNDQGGFFMPNVIIRGVKEDYGWLGNMSPHKIMYENGCWLTAEALFQALRYPMGAVNDKGENIRELIRGQKSPMAAKMMSKKYMDNRNITPMGDEDLDNMRMVLRLKFKQIHNTPLERDLLETGDKFILEDCSKRPTVSGRFWGAQRVADGIWKGTNKLGQLLMELRTEIRNRPAVQ